MCITGDEKEGEKMIYYLLEITNIFEYGQSVNYI